MAALAGAIQRIDARDVSVETEVDALCRGAAALSQDSNRIAARALLWAAVAIDPQSFLAHRRLAAALLHDGDKDAAAEEYARFIELLLKEHDVSRAAAELAYARAFLGDVPQLRSVAAHQVPLEDIARTLDGSPVRALSSGNGHRLSTRPPVNETTATRARPHRHRRSWLRRLASELGMGEYLLVISLATAATVVLVFVIAGLR